MEFEKILLSFIIFALIFSLIVLLVFFIDLILSLVKNLKIKRCSKTTHEVIENEVVEKQAQDNFITETKDNFTAETQDIVSDDTVQVKKVIKKVSVPNDTNKHIAKVQPKVRVLINKKIEKNYNISVKVNGKEVQKFTTNNKDIVLQ